IWSGIWNVNDGTVRQRSFCMSGEAMISVWKVHSGGMWAAGAVFTLAAPSPDFNLGPRLQQAGDDYQAHCWKMAADDPAIGFANFLLPCNIGRLFGNEPGQAGQMRRHCPRVAQ